jgi:aldose sugar dehydrogenase
MGKPLASLNGHCPMGKMPAPRQWQARDMPRAIALPLILLLACGLCGCTRKEPPALPPAAADDDGSPLEAREPNARNFRPAFPGQTRAPGIRAEPAPQVQVITDSLEMPWAVEPLPDGRLLVSEKPGRLRIVAADGTVSAPVRGLPSIHYGGQAGLLDVALDPSFATSRIVYFCYSEPRSGGTGTTLASARLLEEEASWRLDALSVLFRQLPTMDSDRKVGARIVVAADGTLLLTLGERGDDAVTDQAQDLGNHLGKIIRVNADGSVPADNPFMGHAGARAEIWSLGHRNVQAAALDPASGRLWVAEHGPRGGDELNLVARGGNYGWPVISYGIDYGGGRIGAGLTQHSGMEQPVYYWDPDITPSGMILYQGDLFPQWKGSLFIGELSGMKLTRLQMQEGRVVGEQWLLQDRHARIRDVQQGPDGTIYVLTEEGLHSSLLRLRPAG